MRKEVCNKKINSQIKKPHLKRIHNKDNKSNFFINLTPRKKNQERLEKKHKIMEIEVGSLVG